MDLSGFVKLIRRWALVLIVSTVLAGVAGFLVTTSREAKFDAEVQLLVGPLSGDFQILRSSANIAETYADLSSGTQVLQAAAERAGIAIEPAAFRDVLRARANDLTRILSLRVSHSDSDSAAALANALGAELVEMADASVEADTSEEATAGAVRVVEAAVPPVTSSGPGAPMVAALAALAGLSVAFVLVLAVEAFGDRVRDAADVDDLTGGACIPIADPHSRRFRLRRSVAARGAYRLITAALDAQDGPNLARSIAIMPVSDDGAGPEIAFRVADTLGAAGHNVLLVDADPDRAVSVSLGLGDLAGLAEYIRPPADVDSSRSLWIASDRPAVSILAAGSAGGTPADHDQALKALQRLLNNFDRIVLVTGSPTLDGGNLGWAGSADAVLLVAAAGRTRRGDLAEAAASLRVAGAKLTATILRR